MNNIEQFNQILNLDKKNRFKLWENYRKKLTEFIIHNSTNNHSSLDALVLGVGNSDDLDLIILRNTFKSLTLSDIDLDALHKATTKYNLTSSDANVLKIDYVGLNLNSKWNDFVKIMLKTKSKNDIDFYFNELETTILEYRFDHSNKYYDMIIVSPIYTQLLLQQGLSYISILRDLNFSLEFLEHMNERLIGLMPSVIENFNKNIFQMLNKKSTLIAISDIFEAQINTDFYDSLSKNIQDNSKIESIYNQYKNTYGLGLGDYGLIHLETLLNHTQFRWFEWPFNETKSLFVKVVIYKN